MENKSKYTKSQRIVAIITVVIILSAYLAALIFNLLHYEWANKIGKVALGCTLVLPILAWIYIWFVGKIFHKHTIADFDLMGEPTNHDSAIVADTQENKDK